MRSRCLRLQVSILRAILTSFLVAAPASAPAEIVRDPLWITDGEVRAVAYKDNTVFIGGAFENVGPAVGAAAVFDAGSGASIPPFWGVTGTVKVMVPDGTGGYYLGGQFNGVKGHSRNNLAQVDGSGNVTSWNPDASGEVLALAISGSTVYVGGSFAQMADQPRQNLAAVDAVTGTVSAWAPNPNGSVRAFAFHTTNLIVGGAFHSVEGQTRHLVASFDLVSGSLQAWAPNGSTSTGSVNAIGVFGSRVFLAGAFGVMGGQLRSNLASVDATTGAATTWNPIVSGHVNALVITQVLGIPEPIPTIWIGGEFSQVSLTARNRIAAIHGNTGALGAFNVTGADGAVRALRVRVNQFGALTSFFVGGDFTTIAGAPRRYIASLNNTGGSNAWGPNPTGPVHCLVFGATNQIVAGGKFHSANMTSRANIAAFDAFTGAPNNFILGANGAVNTLLVHRNSLFVGGAFSQIGTSVRSGAAEIQIPTYSVTAWDPILTCDVSCAPPEVFTIAPTNNWNAIYVGGSFSHSWGQFRRNVVSVSKFTGEPSGFNVNANFRVRTIALQLNPAMVIDPVTVYIGGDFNRLNAGLHGAPTGGEIRYNLAAVDPFTGKATSWDPTVNTSGPVHALRLTQSAPVDPGILWVGGSFSEIGGQLRNNVAAIDGATGLATPWNPDANGRVRALHATPTGLFLGGDFTSVGGQLRNHLACVDDAGAVGVWNPDAAANVHALTSHGGTIFAGGGFSQVSKYAHQFFAGIGDGVVTAVEPEAAVPASPSVARAMPNPFHRGTTLRFALPRRESARVAVYDVAGRLVRELHHGVLEAREHVMDWNGKDAGERPVAAGMYFLRVDTASVQTSAKVFRLR